eukprot:396150_1
MEEDDNFIDNNIEMMNAQFRLENDSVRNANMFSEIENIEENDNYMSQRQPVSIRLQQTPFFRTSVAPNQFGHFHINKCYNIEPQMHTIINGNNTQFEPQIQMNCQQSVSDTSTESTGCSITGQANIFSPQTNIIIPQTNTVRGGSICCGCQEHQCRCNTRSNSPQIIHYNPQSYYVHNQRQFQYSYGYLNPSQTIHNNMSIQNESKQRRVNYFQQMNNRQ